MSKKVFYIVLATDGREVCGSEIYDDALKREADKVGGAIVNSLGDILFVSEHAGEDEDAEAEAAELADLDDSALLDSTSEEAPSEGDGING